MAETSPAAALVYIAVLGALVLCGATVAWWTYEHWRPAVLVLGGAAALGFLSALGEALYHLNRRLKIRRGQRPRKHRNNGAPPERLRAITNIAGSDGSRHFAVVIDADGGEVARISRYGTDAHALLFAAAPDLLDACKALLAAQTGESVAAARRAIAKAEDGGRR